MKKHLLPIVFSVISLSIWAFYYNELPAELPIHWDINGIADRYASKLHAFLMVHGFMIGMYVFMQIFPKIDPRKENTVFYRRGYVVIAQFIPLLFFGIGMATVYIGLGNDFDMAKMVFALVGILLVVIGNYIPQTKTNFFAGVRTPWTFANETVWRKSNRLSGYLFIVSGVLFLFGIFLPTKWVIWIFGPVIILSAIVPIFYSYWLYKRIVKKDVEE